jgi:hypothetical protein
VNHSFSQNLDEKEFIQNKIPKEQVYLHVNSTLLFSGEKLYYKFYNLNSQSKSLSELSKIGWVSLINADKEEVFSHKLDLDKGEAYSDFFVPSDLPTGLYKILGYTTWMLNAKQNYFEQDIFIINPYQKTKGAVIGEFSTQDSIGKISKDLAGDFSLNLNKESYSTREKVELFVENTTKLSGNYSISVRKIDPLDKPDRITSKEYNNLYQNISWDFSDTLILPEVRGSYFRGKVSSTSIKNFQDNSLYIAFPGIKSELNILPVKKNGEFDFFIGNKIAGDKLLVQMAGNAKDDFTVRLLDRARPDYAPLNFDSKININSNSKDYILNKSINNQIENAYSILKSDELVISKDKNYFFQDELTNYKLDDYTRFKSVEETFIEIVRYGKIRKNKDGSFQLFVNNENFDGYFNLPALLIIDGVIVKDHSKLISYKADKIHSIGLLKSKIFFGPEAFLGAVVVETKSGDFPQEFMQPHIKSIGITTTQLPKQYYSPNYNSTDLSRIPDYRYQLWWSPNLKFQNSKTYYFYTSDVLGQFEVVLEGFTSEGVPVSLSKTFVVE